MFGSFCPLRDPVQSSPVKLDERSSWMNDQAGRTVLRAAPLGTRNDKGRRILVLKGVHNRVILSRRRRGRILMMIRAH